MLYVALCTRVSSLHLLLLLLLLLDICVLTKQTRGKGLLESSVSRSGAPSPAATPSSLANSDVAAATVRTHKSNTTHWMAGV
uniref:Putative secreted protein n=1 Tax=Anopheles darlingi TaxID=43151 RepID=A0A2M4D0S1_ANODA